jgi:hypothetical protein
MIPKFHPGDPLMGGEWRAFDGWAWFCWMFASGWVEWVPAFPFLLCVATYSARLSTTGDLVTQFDLYHHTMDLVREMHQRVVGGPPIGYTALHVMVAEQTEYSGLQKSDWYYNSIPMVGT